MSERIKEKIVELGIVLEDVEDDIIEFLDRKYRKPEDGIEIEDGENPTMGKKMRFFQTNYDGAYLRLRLNRNQRIAETDKIKFRIVIAKEGADSVKIRFKVVDRPARVLKICKVSVNIKPYLKKTY